MTTCPACGYESFPPRYQRCCGRIQYTCPLCHFEAFEPSKLAAPAEKAETSSAKLFREPTISDRPEFARVMDSLSDACLERVEKRVSAAAWRMHEPVRINREHGRVDLLGVTEAFVLNDPNESAPDRWSASPVAVDPPRQPDAGLHGRSGADLCSERDA